MAMGNCEYCGKEQTGRICFHCDTAPGPVVRRMVIVALSLGILLGFVMGFAWGMWCLPFSIEG